MRTKIGLFAFIFVTTTIGNYLFVDRNDIWGALFVGFFTGLICAFVFFPLIQKLKDRLTKKVSEKYRESQ